MVTLGALRVLQKKKCVPSLKIPPSEDLKVFGPLVVTLEALRFLQKNVSQADNTAQ